MKRTLLIVTMVGFVLGAQDAKDDKAKLQGAWQMESSTQGGQEDPNAKERTMVFEKDTVSIKRGDMTVYKGKYKLDTTKSPKQIDITLDESPADRFNGKTGLGVYELKDDTLKWSVNMPGSETRPENFESAAGSATMVVVLKRVKK